jgi:hypothetical protein
MTRILRLAVLAAAVTALAGCLPIMFDRDGNWRGQQPVGPAFSSATQPNAAVPPVTEDDHVAADEEGAKADGAEPAAEQ